MEFYFFHLMPWPHLPDDFDQRHSAWVDLSNASYDPVRGHQLYNDYLDQLASAEQLGFDGVCVNEHHQNSYGTMPAPNIIASMLIPRTATSSTTATSMSSCWPTSWASTASASTSTTRTPTA